ncbi:hypothetical protein FQN57_002467 [Myotisia sp. PD_48]|nr:hypothetical protein FQN57_002467 [Myotisia sp. PD_48]
MAEINRYHYYPKLGSNYNLSHSYKLWVQTTPSGPHQKPKTKSILDTFTTSSLRNIPSISAQKSLPSASLYRNLSNVQQATQTNIGLLTSLPQTSQLNVTKISIVSNGSYAGEHTLIDTMSLIASSTTVDSLSKLPSSHNLTFVSDLGVTQALQPISISTSLISNMPSNTLKANFTVTTHSKSLPLGRATIVVPSIVPYSFNLSREQSSNCQGQPKPSMDSISTVVYPSIYVSDIFTQTLDSSKPTGIFESGTTPTFTTTIDPNVGMDPSPTFSEEPVTPNTTSSERSSNDSLKPQQSRSIVVGSIVAGMSTFVLIVVFISWRKYRRRKLQIAKKPSSPRPSISRFSDWT